MTSLTFQGKNFSERILVFHVTWNLAGVVIFHNKLNFTLTKPFMLCCSAKHNFGRCVEQIFRNAMKFCAKEKSERHDKN